MEKTLIYYILFQTTFFTIVNSNQILEECKFDCEILTYTRNQYKLCLRKCIRDRKFEYEFNYHVPKISSRRNDNNDYCRYNLCESFDGYPTEDIESAVNENVNLRSYFGTVIQPHNIEINNRNDIVDADNACETISYNMYPKVAKSITGDERFIVNTRRYNQSVSFDTCKSKNSACLEEGMFPLKHSAKCKQRYIEIKLLTYTINSNVVYDSYKIPSGCVCSYVEDID